jgi:hypothetical protein
VVKKVWVPNSVTETVPVTTSTQQEQVVHYTVYEQQVTQVPYQCTKLVYQPEVRTGTKKTVVYVDEQRSRMRKVVKYNEEPRTRMRKELTYKTVTKTETVPYVTYKTEERTKEVSYTYNVPEHTLEPYQTTRYDKIAEEQVESYTVNIPYTVTEERKVQVCKMVPRLVEEVINPCCNSASGAGGCGGGGGCGGSIAAPVSAGCGSCGAPADSCGCAAPAPVAAPAPCACGS